MWRVIASSHGGIHWGTQNRIFLDGMDVSARCFQAIVPERFGVEGLGQVWLFEVDAKGKFFARGNDTEPAVEVRVGVVRWEPIPHEEPGATC